jgi:predicted O-methyltransferase YrrM
MTQRPSPAEDLERWTAVDRYYESLLAPADPVLEATLRTSAEAGLPDIQVSALQGKLLYLLATACGARRVLEIGTLGGYSTTCLARALPSDGRLLSLELESKHAEVARANLARAGVADRVEIRLGPATLSLEQLHRENPAPFDLVFIDADKASYPEYLDGAVRLSRAGTLIIADNVVRRGDVTEPDSTDPNVQGIRRMNEQLARDPRVSATAIQTVGVKGYDGMMFAVVLRAP